MKTEQAMKALEKGNRVRINRARDKRMIRSGELNPAVLLRDPPDYWLTGTPFQLILPLRRVGLHRVNRWLRAEGISPTTPLGEIPETLRERLALRVTHHTASHGGPERATSGRNE